MQHGFAREILCRLPLAEAGLVWWRLVSEATVRADIVQRNRGRCYQDELAFPVLVNLIADALLEHGGSARKSFQRGKENGELEVSVVSAYGKLGRLPQAVSEAFLAEGTDRLLSVFPLKAVLPPPQGTLFPLAFCMLLYNMIQVIRAHVAQSAKKEIGAVSTELLFDDVRRQLIALHETLTATEIVSLIPATLTAEIVQRRLAKILATEWSERWRKAPPKKRKPPQPKASGRTHCSAYRIIMEARIAQQTKAQASSRP